MRREAQEFEPRHVGWGVSLRLAFFYSFYFTVAAYLLVWFAFAFANRMTNKTELEITYDRLEELLHWGEPDVQAALTSRFSEFRIAHPDVFFIRLRDQKGEISLVSGTNSPPILDLDRLQDIPIELTAPRLQLGPKNVHTWTLVSQELDDGTILQIGKNSSGAEAVIRHFHSLFWKALFPIVITGFFLGLLIGFQSMLPTRELGKTIQRILRKGKVGERVYCRHGARELRQLSASFNQMLDHQEAQTDAMRQSLEGLAHDLKNPLTRLNATLETALQDAPPPHQHIHQSLEECDLVLGILGTLLEIQSLELGTAQLGKAPVNMTSVIRETLDVYEFMAKEKEIAFEFEAQDGLQVMGDQALLFRMMTNLVDNSVKYSPKGATISITAKQEAKTITVRVHDQGPGIPEAEREKVWVRLFRGQHAHGQNGFGLGLAIVRSIVEAHQGTVEILSPPSGTGAILQISLPSFSNDRA
ncbi:HAMP domain-containing histidine kinase [Akkermansiaceae bacterium]|nr:HAMP domain-containing histidine kinase [Akkermansiaceae bacterium]